MSTTCDLCGKLRGAEEFDLRHDFTQPGYPPSIMLCARCYDALDSMPPVFSWETAKQALLVYLHMSRGQRNRLNYDYDRDWDWDDLFSNKSRSIRRGGYHGKLRPEYEYKPKVFDHSPVPFGHVSIAAPVTPEKPTPPKLAKSAKPKQARWVKARLGDVHDAIRHHHTGGTSCLTCARFTTAKRGCPVGRNGHPDSKICPTYEEAYA